MEKKKLTLFLQILGPFVFFSLLLHRLGLVGLPVLVRHFRPTLVAATGALMLAQRGRIDHVIIGKLSHFHDLIRSHFSTFISWPHLKKNTNS